MNSTVYDAFRCLNLLATANRPKGIREMGRELELDSAKVTRLMQTLLALDMVQRDARRKYSLGIGIHRLSAQAIHNSAFYNAVMDLLEESGNHAISIVIGALSGKNVVYLIHTRGGESIARAIGNYQSFPVHDSVIGIKLLSAMSDEEIIAQIGINDYQLLRQDIDEARRHQVFAKDFGPGDYRLACNIPGMQAAIALSNINSERMDTASLRLYLTAAARKISGESLPVLS
ncbi:helix-turn-helix domain-containing protein [Erwinia sp. S38]|uniref:helix-turn-helix domain-containing protein n=1 Tax=Erwinia sp. S38 TaxID=2769338 RepID=UPI00190E2664|nr:helix-turn-helix domain-containing protein [Erwinia sp. S38]MBK0000693.1 helix-turn-helix domain-containing protein [Erwinia sp. S38]